MYTYPGKAKAAIYTIAASMAHAGQTNSQPDAGRTEPPIVHQDLSQEVTVIPIPLSDPKGKAAVAAAAQSAQMSVFVVIPLYHRSTETQWGSAHIYSPSFSFNPFQTTKSPPCLFDS